MPESLKSPHEPEDVKGKLESKEITNTSTDGGKHASRKAAAEMVIHGRLNHIGHAEHTEVIKVPEIGTEVTLNANDGKAYKGKVVRIDATDTGVEVIVQAGPEFPDENFAEGETKEYPVTAEEFNELFGQPSAAQKTERVTSKTESDSSYEAVMDTIAAELLDPALATKGEISLTKQGEIIRAAAQRLHDANLESHLDDVKDDIIELIEAHNKQVATVSTVGSTEPIATAENLVTTPEAKPAIPSVEDSIRSESLAKKAVITEAFDKALRDNPNIESDLDKLSKELATLLQSFDSTPEAIKATYEHIIAEAKGLPGMNDVLLASIQRQWESMRKNADNLNPLKTLVARHLADTETPITQSVADSLMAVLDGVPNLNNAVRKEILTAIGKKFEAHNQAIETRAKTPQKDLPNNDAPGPEIEMIEPTDDPSQQTETIEVSEHELEDAPAHVIDEPEFMSKIDGLDEEASKLLQAMSTNPTGSPIDIAVFENLLEKAIKNQNLRVDSQQAKAWLSAQKETATQINQGIDALNQEDEKALVTITDCHQRIDSLLAEPDPSTLEEITALQTQISTLSDGPEKAELQNRLLEIHEHDQAVLKADALVAEALASDREISLLDLGVAIGKLLPTAVERYMQAAEPIIDQHNTKIQNIPTETAPQDQAVPEVDNDQLLQTISDCHQKIDDLLSEPDPSSLEEIAAIQTKISTLSDGPEKTELQDKLLEVQAHDQAVLKADALVAEALATDREISLLDLGVEIGKLLPKAVDQYMNAAEAMIDEHNTKLHTAATPDQPIAGADGPAAVEPNDTPAEPKASTPDNRTAVFGSMPDQAKPVAEPVVVRAIPDVTDTLAAAVPADSGKAAPLDSTPTIVKDTTTTHADTTPPTPPEASPSPKAEVLSAAPIAPVETTLDKATEAKRDAIFDLIDKNPVLSESEKARMMVKVVELLRTANKDTDFVSELQRFMVAGDQHQEAQRQVLEQSEPFAEAVQNAVQSALDTHSLDYKKNEAAFQEMLALLPTAEARTAMQALYDSAISDKKLRGNASLIQKRVQEILENQAEASSKRNDSLEPLFKKISAQMKTEVRPEAQVLGAQTIAPDLSQWEAPAKSETVDAPESYRATAKRKLGELVDRIRGRKSELETTNDTTSTAAETEVKSPSEIVTALIDTNLDLTAAEKAQLKATALELLDKGTDISKTVEKLKASLAERVRINQEISALVLDAPEIGKQMYFALSAALQEDISAEKRTAAFTQWQGFVDKLPTGRAKEVVKTVYAQALQDKNLRSNIDALEETITIKFAETGMEQAREKALATLVNTLGNEINKAIAARKSTENPIVTPVATPAVAPSATPQETAPIASDIVTVTPQVSETIDANDSAEKQKAFLGGIERLIAETKKQGAVLDTTTLHMYALKSNQIDKALLGETLAKIDELVAGKVAAVVDTTQKAAEVIDTPLPKPISVVLGSAPEKVEATEKPTDAKLNESLITLINRTDLNAEQQKRDVLPKEFFASDLDQLVKVMEQVKDPDLTAELQAIKKLLVESSSDKMIGAEAEKRLEKALFAQYPELFATIQKFVVMHVQDHNNRLAMSAEIAKHETELKEKPLSGNPDSMAAEIKDLKVKFGSVINEFAVEKALANLQQRLEREKQVKAAVDSISMLWATRDSLALPEVNSVLDRNNLTDIKDKLATTLATAGAIQNRARTEKRAITAGEKANILMGVHANFTDVPQTLKQALTRKVAIMIQNYNSRLGGPVSSESVAA